MKINEDKNLLGRIVALACIAAVGYGVHRINCGGMMCPVMKSASCCPTPVPEPKGPAVDAAREEAAAPAPVSAPKRKAAPAVEPSPEAAPR